MATKNGIVGDIAFMAAGSLIGAGIALLLAPQSGKQTRQDLAYFGKMAKNRSERALLELSHKANKLTDEMKSVLESGKGYLRKMA
jgi:gas vesicle protein